MLTFSEMKSQVADRISIDNSDYNSKIGDWINYRYDDIVGRHDWPQLYRTSTVSISEGDATVAFPRDVDLLVNIHDRTNDVNLMPLNPSAGGRGYADVQDSNGKVTIYWWEGVSVLNQPSSASTIDVNSTSASDTTQTVRIWGTDSNGAEITETVDLNGTTAVSSTNSFARVDRVSKDANTVGLIQGVVSSTTIFKIDPYNFGATNNKIRIIQPSDSSLTLNYTYKYKVPRLINAEDTPVFDCSQSLVLGAYISALRQQRQHSKAKALEYNPQEPYDPTTYEGKVRSLIQRIEQQAENVPVFRPMVDKAAIDKPYNWRI